MRESHSCFNMLDIARLRVLNSMQLILLTYVSLQKWCYKKNGGSCDKFRVVGVGKWGRAMAAEIQGPPLADRQP